MLYAIVAVIALILDQITKYWTSVNIVENTAGYTEVKALIPGLIRLTNFHNSGAAFSFLANASWARWFFVVLCLIFVAVVIYVLLQDIITSPGARWAAVFVMAGALGNCIDRVITGYVVDMLEFDFTILGRRFPVFNVADMYITLGAIVFVIFMLLEKPKEKENAPRAGGTGSPAKKTDAPAEAARTHVSVPAAPADTAEQGDDEEDLILTDLFGEPKKSAKPETPPPNTTKNQVSRIPPAREPEKPEDGKAPSKTELVMRTLVRGRAEEAAPAPEAAPQAAPVPAPAKAAPVLQPPKAETPAAEGAEPSYDLEDILAEFRDL